MSVHVTLAAFSMLCQLVIQYTRNSIDLGHCILDVRAAVLCYSSSVTHSGDIVESTDQCPVHVAALYYAFEYCQLSFHTSVH
jgi:hypothetical protein